MPDQLGIGPVGMKQAIRDKLRALLDSAKQQPVARVAGVVGDQIAQGFQGNTQDDPDWKVGAASVLPFRSVPVGAKTGGGFRPAHTAEEIADLLPAGADELAYGLDVGAMDTLRSMSPQALRDSLEALSGRGVVAEKMGPQWVAQHREYWGSGGAKAMRDELVKRSGMKIVK